MINETLDTATEPLEAIIFTNIIARKFWTESKPSEIKTMYQILNDTVCREQKYDVQNSRIDKVCVDIVLINSVLFN